VDRIATEGEERVMGNLKRKAAQSIDMFDKLVSNMKQSKTIERVNHHVKELETPSWL